MFNNTVVNTGASVAATTGNTSIHTIDVLANLTAAVTFQTSAGVTYFVLPANTVAKSYVIDAQFASGLTIASANASDYGLVLANVSQ